MYEVVGSKTCSRCGVVRNVLNSKNIEYKYILLDDVSEDEKERYLTMAREQNKLHLPLIIKDNKIIDLKEVQ